LVIESIEKQSERDRASQIRQERRATEQVEKEEKQKLEEEKRLLVEKAA